MKFKKWDKDYSEHSWDFVYDVHKKDVIQSLTIEKFRLYYYGSRDMVIRRKVALEEEV